jgi:predicted house-cleaning noncanonical NTP pyrophosphatase (MazG superfamily)
MIQKRGKRAEWETIKSDKEFLRFLLIKMVEESSEANYALAKGNLEEELADVVELVDNILRVKGWTWKKIRNIQKLKRQKNGGFKKRIMLLK